MSHCFSGFAGAGAADWQNAAVPVERNKARIVNRIAHPHFTDVHLPERVANTLGILNPATHKFAVAKRTRLGEDCATVPHTCLVPEFQYRVGYFFPLSLKFSAR
jgi:hypothetical protein